MAYIHKRYPGMKLTKLLTNGESFGEIALLSGKQKSN